MTTLPVNFETLKVSGITDITQIQNIIPTIQIITDPKGNLLTYTTPIQSNFNILNITDPKGNIVDFK